MCCEFIIIISSWWWWWCCELWGISHSWMNNLDESFGSCQNILGNLLKFFSLFYFLKTKIAHLLGVAGADIPVSDIKRLMQPFIVRPSISSMFMANLTNLFIVGSRRICFHYWQQRIHFDSPRFSPSSKFRVRHYSATYYNMSFYINSFTKTFWSQHTMRLTWLK